MANPFIFLLIDDSQQALSIYSRLLERAGHQTVSLNSCDNAMEQIIKLKPDCVVCDLMMPGMDGLDLFKQIRLNNVIKQPTFIIISAKHYDYDRRNALKIGVDAYMTKPIDHKTFVTDLIAIINNKKA